MGGQTINQAAKDQDPDEAFLRVSSYPDCMAATLKAEGITWPIAFEDFIKLPEQFVIKWEAAVYELNPHWLPVDPEKQSEKKKEDLRKKVLKSSSD